jgi:hypothetical protein
VFSGVQVMERTKEEQRGEEDKTKEKEASRYMDENQ